MKNVVVIGTGGLAREFSAYFGGPQGLVHILGYSSADAAEHATHGLPGQWFGMDITPQQVGTADAVLAIGDPAVKRRVHDSLRALGFSFPSLVHPSAVVAPQAVVEEGVVVSPQCVVSPGATLKAMSYLNFCCGVGHDALVGRYTQVNPGAQLGGFARIGDGCLVGSGAVVLQGVQVGEDATLASGAVVFSRVADGATMMGNPAKRMRAFEG